MMLLVGCAWVVDLRLLGIARSIPIGPLRPLFRIMWAAFWINLATGVLLFIADPERKATSLLFGFKMLLIIDQPAAAARASSERSTATEPEPATVDGSEHGGSPPPPPCVVGGNDLRRAPPGLRVAEPMASLITPGNLSHLHLLLNHFPTVGLTVAFVLLVDFDSERQRCDEAATR